MTQADLEQLRECFKKHGLVLVTEELIKGLFDSNRDMQEENQKIQNENRLLKQISVTKWGPEIIRCKDCIKQSTCSFSQYQGNDGYCSLAERRTDE